MPLRSLSSELQAKLNHGIIQACQRFGIDVRGNTDFQFDTDACYTQKQLAPSTLAAYVEYYFDAWQFFASTGCYESLLPLVKSPEPLRKPFPAMQVEALVALIDYKRLPTGTNLSSWDNNEPVRHVVTGEVIECTNEWAEKDVEAFSVAISRLHRAAGHRVDRYPSQMVCDACLAKYRASGGDRSCMEPCPLHVTETVNPPIIRWGDPTRHMQYKDALLLQAGVDQERNVRAAQITAEKGDDTGNNHNVDWIIWKLSKLPISSQYPDLLERCRPIIEAWHEEFSVTQPPVWWSRLRRNLPKELNESAFILDEILSVIEDYEGDQPMTIVDMCSGVGFLSMFLSHLLPPSKVSRIVSVDILFRSHNDVHTGTGKSSSKGQDTNNPEPLGNEKRDGEDEKKPQTNHLQTSHLRSAIHPIPIRPRRANIKRDRELRQIAQHCVALSPGPVIILGIHLCKSLSVHTVRLFTTTLASRLYLKPCCLPGRRELGRKHPPFWAFEQMIGGGFGVDTLYCQEIEKDGRDKLSPPLVSASSKPFDSDTMATKGQQQITGGNLIEENGHTHTGVQLYFKWVSLLRDAADTAPGATTEIHHMPALQVRGYQNQFLVATR